VFGLLLSVLILASQLASAHEDSAKGPPAQVFPTGNEQVVIEGFISKPEEAPAEGFANALDQALAVLTARAYPKPQLSRLINATMLSLCDELERQTQHMVGDAQREAWLKEVTRSRSMESVLRVIDSYDLEQDVRSRIIEAGLKGMLKALEPTAGRLLTPDEAGSMKEIVRIREDSAREPGFLGVALDRWPILDVAPDTPASEAGLRNGDVVVMVNGEEVGHVKTPADAKQLLAGPVGDSIQLKVNRDGESMTFDVRRASGAAMKVQARWLTEGVAYVKISSFEGSGIADRAAKVLREYAAKGALFVVLDLRDNPGGRPEEANAVADLFLDNKLLEVLEFKTGVRIAFKSNPGAINAEVVILTNKSTGSAAEMLTMALHDNGRATVVGEATAHYLFGKDTADLTGGHAILFRNEPTVLSPTGNDYSAAGIPPDIPVVDSRVGEEDAILAQAIEFCSRSAEKRRADSTGDPTAATGASQ